MIKLKKLIKESKIELGKVYTAKDNPPFKTDKQIEEELIKEQHGLKVSSVRELQRALKSAFNDIYKGKMPQEIYQGATGEFFVTISTGPRGGLVEFSPSGIVDAIRDLKKFEKEKK